MIIVTLKGIVFLGLGLFCGNNTSDSINDLKVCTWNGIELLGRVQLVENFPDIKVQVVDAFPDIKVQLVDAFPDECGQWLFVDEFPDFTVQYVHAFPDIKIQYVKSFPGIVK